MSTITDMTFPALASDGVYPLKATRVVLYFEALADAGIWPPMRRPRFDRLFATYLCNHRNAQRRVAIARNRRARRAARRERRQRRQP